ncbi:MAG: type IV pilus assembly protein FimV, partial [Hylemonella sp.]
QGERPISSTYVDLIVEAHVSDNRVVRGYTVLVPATRKLQTLPPPLAPQVQPQTPQPPASAPMIAPAPTISPPSPQAAGPVAQVAPAPAAPASSTTGPAAQAAPAKPPATAATAAKRLVVKSGDTAGAIAESIRPAQVSLDQMLLALLNANPDAFIDANVNRIKSGAVLAVPDVQQALSTPAQQASNMIRAQTQDFNEYRRKLALGTAQIPPSDNARASSGDLQARVEEKRTTPVPDKLTLSNAQVKEKSQEDDLVVKGNQQEDERQASELSKNIDALKKLSAEIAQSGLPTGGSQELATKAPDALPQPEANRPSALIDRLVSSPAVLIATGLLVVLLASLAFFQVQRRSLAEAGSLEDVLRESVSPKQPDPSSGPSPVTENSVPPTPGAGEKLSPSADLQPTPFDLSTINLDLDTPPSRPPADLDAMSVKLALAEECMALGNKEGARILLEEMMAEAQGDLYLQAKKLQQQLG